VAQEWPTEPPQIAADPHHPNKNPDRAAAGRPVDVLVVDRHPLDVDLAGADGDEALVGAGAVEVRPPDVRRAGPLKVYPKMCCPSTATSIGLFMPVMKP
jgi:hypothetical protein